MKILKTLLVGLAVAGWVGHAAPPVHDHNHDHGHDHVHEHHEGHAHGPVIHVGASAQKLIGIQTVRGDRRRLESSVDLYGRFVLMPSARSVAVAPVVGTVELRVRALQTVRKGDVLFEVASSDLRTRTAEIAVLERRWQGYVQSGAKNAGLRAELDLRRAELAALLGSASASNGVIAVRSAIDGVVAKLAVSQGGAVEKGGTVVELVDPHALGLKVRLPAGDRSRLKSGMPVRVGGSQGVLEFDTAEPAEVLVVFAKPDPSWRAGDLAKGVCITETSGKDALVVPSEAVVQIGVTPMVFVRDEDESDHFIALAVEVGRRANGWTEILNLHDDDQEVVVRGQYELKLALAAAKGDGGKKTAHYHADGTVHDGDD